MGVTANTPSFQTAFTASIMSVLPAGSTVTITSVKLFWSDGTVTASRRRELLLATVVGVQVAYNVVTPPSAGSTSSLEALLANPTTVSAVSTNLAATFPDAVVQAPLVLTPTSAPTVLPTFTPSSSPTAETAPVLTPISSPVTSPVVSSPLASPVATPVTTPTTPIATTSGSTTVTATQSVSSATLTVAQAQSGSFASAFAAGIQGSVPGVTVTVTSVTASRRRRILASVIVSYTAISTSTDTATLTASLSNSVTVAAISTSLSNAGYSGVSVSSPVIVPSAPTTTSSSSSGGGSAGSSSSSGSSGGGGSIAVIAGAVVGGLVLIAVAVLVPVLLMRNKKPASNRFELTPEVNWDPNELVSLDQQQPQLPRQHLEASTMDAGGQGYVEEEPPVYSPYHENPRSRSVSQSEKSVSSMDNESVREGSEQGPSIGAAAFHRKNSLMEAGIHVQSNMDVAPDQRQAADVNNNSTSMTPLIPLPRAWSHAVTRMSLLRPKSVTINEPSQPSAVMTTQLVTGIENDSDNFRASFVAAVASTINSPDIIVRVVMVTKVDAGLSVVYKIASHASDAQSIEQTLSSGVAAMSEELQKTFPGTAVATPKVVPVSSPNKPLPQPRAPATKQAQLLPPQPPQPQVVELTMSIVGVTNPSSSNFRAVMMESLAHLLPPETTAEIVSVSSVKGRTSVVCKITTTSATAGNADKLVATLQSSKNMLTLTKDLRATFPTAIIAPPSITVLPSPSVAEEGEEGISSSFGIGDLYREKRPHEIAHRHPVHVVSASASTFHRPRQVPSHLGRPPRIVLPEDTLWVPPSWTTPDGKNVRISDEEMHMMDVNAARNQAARRHSVTSIDSQYTDVWKHTRYDEAAHDDDRSIVSMVQCEEYEDKAHALLMEKLYTQDDEFNAVMAEIMRAEVTREP